MLVASAGVSVFAAVSVLGAGVTISLTPATASAGSSGDAFDVDLINMSSAPITVGAFSFQLSTANTNITFTGATTSTAATYVFSGNSAFGPDIGAASGQNLSGSDLAATPLSGTAVGVGDTFGLGHVLFDVSAGAASGTFPVDLAVFPDTSLSDPSGNNIPIDTLLPGEITIPNAGTAPEPSSLILLAIGVAALISVAKFRRA